MWKRAMTRGRPCVVRGSRKAEAVTAASADVAAMWVVVAPDVAAGAVLLVVAAAVAVRSVVALPEAPEAAVREASAVAPAALAVLVVVAVDLRWAVA